jgi:hypothetical protein
MKLNKTKKRTESEITVQIGGFGTDHMANGCGGIASIGEISKQKGMSKKLKPS